MTIEEKVFASYQVILDKLPEYGFSLRDNAYFYSTSFHNDEFLAEISVNLNGSLKGRVIEKTFNEEYAPLRNEAYYGGFVGEIREEYKAILLSIREACFKHETFVSNQANRIAILIKEKYDEAPDFPFSSSKIEHYGVFRLKDNAKWYGLIMNVDSLVFGKEEGHVDIINLKVDEKEREAILKTKGIFPSYHMSKTKWISVLLNETLDDEFIMSLIDKSRTLVSNSPKRKTK